MTALNIDQAELTRVDATVAEIQRVVVEKLEREVELRERRRPSDPGVAALKVRLRRLQDLLGQSSGGERDSAPE